MRRRFLAALTAAGAATTAMAALPPAPAWAGQNHAPQAPTGLTVGDQARPLNVEGSPAFGWLPRDVDPGEVQSAYEIKVSAGGRTVWDSGKVASSQESYVPGPGDLPHGSGFTWTVRTWDRAGEASPWAKPAEFDTGVADADWQASWIRRTTGEKDDYTYARKEFTVGASPIVRARAYVAASQQYDLHVNGTLADRGAAFAYPGEGYYRAVDITRLLKPGKTAAVGALYHWYGPGQGRPSGEPGLLMRVVVDHADGTRQVIVTDGSWKVARANWKTTKYRNGDGRDYIEDIDGTTEPLGWDKAGFDDSSWAAPQVVGAHPAGVFTHLRAQESALAYETVHPVTVTKLASGAVVADFGRIIPAVPVVRFRDGAAGTAVTMTAGYLLAGDGTVSNSSHDNQTTDLTYRYTERNGDQTVRYYTYEGFRYLQIGADVPAGDISAIVQHTDVPSRTRLRTSSGGVDAVYDLMQRSALYDSQEQFLDTPTREKGQFLGDSVDVSLATMSGWGERRLTRKAIREFIQSQARYWPDGRLNAVYPNGDGKRDIPDYTEMFPGWVWEYYLQSGDAGTLGQAYPVMAAVADYVRRSIDPSTGLVTKLAGGSGSYLNGIIDWPNRYGYDTAAVARTTVNELAVDVLNATARAAKALGKDSSAYERDAATLTTAINGRLRRADGVYIDGLEADGSQSTHASQIANAYAVAFGLTSDAKVTDYVASLGLQMSPMTVHWLMAALADRPQDLVTRLTDPNGIGYGRILASGGTFAWESWEAPETGDSLSHGWGASPVIDVQQDLLGVAVTAPGAAAIRVRPPASGLTSASGTVPTQRGDVHVSWHRSGGRITVYVDVPVNVTAEIDLPTTGKVKVKGDADHVGRENGRTVYRTGSGHHTFTAQG